MTETPFVRRFSVTRVGFLLAAAVVGASCTLVFAQPEFQCSNDTDCANRGAEFDGAVCSQGLCIQAATIKPKADGGDDAGGTCTSNRECTLELTKPARCVEGSCVAYVTADCPAYEGDPNAENPVFVGYLAPFSRDSDYSIRTFRGIRVAVKEYNAALGAIPGKRPIIAVACDEGRDPAASTQFLVNDLRVRSMLGSTTANTFQTVREIALKRGVTVIDTTSAGPGIPNDLVWAVQPARDVHVRLFNAELEVITERIKALDPGFTTLRVSVLVSSEVDATAFADELGKVAHFNGKSAAENLLDGNFGTFAYDDPVYVPGTNTDSEAAASLLAFALAEPTEGVANLIVTTSNNQIGPADKVFAQWPVSEKPAFYAFPPPVWATVELSDWAGSNPDFWPYAFAVDWKFMPEDKGLQGTFASSYKSKVGADPPAWVDVERYGYDALYVNAYALEAAAAAAGVSIEEVTPAQFAAAMLRLTPPGTPVSVNDARNVFVALAAPESRADVRGVASPLDFEPDTHAPTMLSELKCMSNGRFHSTGIVFDPKTGKASGTYACP